MEGFRQATSGAVEVLGHDPWRAPASWRARIGIVLQESEAEPGLSVRECLGLYAGYYPAPRDVDDTLALVDLADQSDQRASTLSGGQRRRLDVALALIGDPELIFLDEPTTGFDPAARRAAWEVIAGLRDLGKTVFLTTHYMEEAERLADRIAVIAAGQIVAEGTPQTLGDRQLEAAQISFSAPEGSTAAELPDALGGAADPARQRPARAGEHARDRRPVRARRMGARARAGARRPGGHSPDARGRLPATDNRNRRPAKEPTMIWLFKFISRKWREFTANRKRKG